MSEFKVGGTYICTTAHYKNYKIFYNNTIFYRLTWAQFLPTVRIPHIMELKKQQNKTKPKKSHNPKIKIEL